MAERTRNECLEAKAPPSNYQDLTHIIEEEVTELTSIPCQDGMMDAEDVEYSSKHSVPLVHLCLASPT